MTTLQSRLHQEQIETEKGSYRREHNEVELQRLIEQNKTVATLLAEGESRAGELEADLATTEQRAAGSRRRVAVDAAR